MMLDNIWLDGESAFERGIRLQKEVEFDAPEPDAETESIPGRSGDIVYWDGAFKNVKGTAVCYCLSPDAAATVRAANSWLLAKGGEYRRLETLLEPHVFRRARIVRAAKLAPRLNRINAFEIEFDCMAPKWLKDGEKTVTLTSGAALRNPTGLRAKPLITLDCTETASTLTVGARTLEIGTTGQNIILDCAEEEMYRLQGGSRVNLGYYAEGDFPVLDAGENAVSWSNGISNVRIQTRWWSL